MVKRHTITNKERGHRPSLSESEPTVSYTIKMPLSLKQKCVKWGANFVRKLLEQAKKNDMETDFTSTNKQSESLPRVKRRFQFKQE